MLNVFISAEAQLDFHLKRFNEISVSMASKPENNVDLITSSSTSTSTTPTPRTRTTTPRTAVLTTIKTITSTAIIPTAATILTKSPENRGKMRLHHLHLQNKNADKGSVQFHKNNIAIVQTTTPMTAVVLEKVLVTTQPVYPAKFGIQPNENVLPQKTIDYNSVAEEFTDNQNETVIDLIMQTQLKTEPVTTPEPSMILILHLLYSFVCCEYIWFI